MSQTASRNDMSQRLQRLLGYVSADPANAPLLTDSLGLALHLDQMAVAADLAGKAAVLPHKPATLLAHLGLFYLRTGKFDEALAAGRDSLGMGGASEACVYNTAYAAFRTGAHRESLALLLPLYPEAAVSPDAANILIARNQHFLGEIDGGIARLTACLSRQDAPPAEALGLRALMHSDNNDTDAALADARRALTLAPDQTEALLALAEAHKDLGNYPEATAAYQHLLRVDENAGRAWSGLAQTAMAELDLDAAEQHATRATALMEGHIGTWHVLAWTHILKGNSAAARSALEHALQLDRNFAESHGSLAVVDVMEGRLEDAERKIRVAERLDKHSLALNLARMSLLEKRGDTQAAKDLGQQVLGRKAPASNLPGAALLMQRLEAILARQTRH